MAAVTSETMYLIQEGSIASFGVIYASPPPCDGWSGAGQRKRAETDSDDDDDDFDCAPAA
jgi:hypothetical protein